jgi:hypothetical protein
MTAQYVRSDIDHPIGGYIEDRKERLHQLNDFLSKKKLRPFQRIGIISEGEMEITRLLEVYTHSEKFFTDMVFEIQMCNASGEVVTGRHSVRFNANGYVNDEEVNGLCCVVKINGNFVIVKQFRIAIGGRYTYECIRGFVPESLSDIRPESKILKRVFDELGEDLYGRTRINHALSLGKLWQNTGTDNVLTEFLLIEMEIDDEILQRRLAEKENQRFQLRLYSWAEFEDAIGTKVNDTFSVSAFMLYSKYARASKVAEKVRGVVSRPSSYARL